MPTNGAAASAVANFQLFCTDWLDADFVICHAQVELEHTVTVWAMAVNRGGATTFGNGNCDEILQREWIDGRSEVCDLDCRWRWT